MKEYRFRAFFMFVLFFYIPPPYYQIFAQSGHLCAKLFLAETNDAHKQEWLPFTSNQKKKTFLPQTTNKNDMKWRGYMLQKHLQKFAQWEQLFQELCSCNSCSSFQKEQKKGGRGGGNKQRLPSLSTKHPKNFTPPKTKSALSNLPFGLPIFAR